MALESVPSTTVENPFDRVTALAAALFKVPMSVVSVIDHDRAGCRGSAGIVCGDSASEDSFCRHALAMGPGRVLVVEDALLDPVFSRKPAVTGEPNIRFYAGAVITRRDGRVDGALCIMDTRPRPRPSQMELDQLRLLADLTAAQIDLIDQSRIEQAQLETLKLAESMAGIGHWRLDAITQKVFWSDEVFRIHGFEPGAIDPTTHRSLGAYHPDDRVMIDARVKQAIATGEGYDSQLRLHRPDGEERVTQARARCEIDESGAVTALFGVFQDITESVRAQDQQAELVETLKLAETMAGIGCWRLDIASGRVRWSDGVYRIHGVTPQTFDPSLDDAVGFYHPDDQQAVRDWCAKAIESGESGGFRLRLIRANGEERIVESQCRPERGAGGTTTALFGVFQDVTESVRSHERIVESEARYRLMADGATDIMITYGVDGIVTYVSPSVETVSGRAPADVVGRPVTDLIHPEDVPALAASFRALAKAGPGEASPGVRYRGGVRTDTVQWFEARTSVIRNEAGRAVAFHDVVRDITETKRLEDELIAARDVAEKAARTKSEFLANMSHELRTPLTSVIGFSGLLKASIALPETERRHADRIATASEALLSVINDILDYSKLEAEAVGLDPTPFDPAAMAEGAAAMIEEQCAAKGLGLEIEIDPTLPAALMGDEGRLRQVTLNFLSNAAKFTVSGDIRMNVGWDGSRLRIAVSDSGIGIAAAKIDTLFQRFTQADASTTRVYGGTGLGLAISRRLIELMGGEIGADSRPGEGSTFWLEVPLVPAEADAVQSDVDEITIPAGARVLMADDAPANRELVRAILSGWDIQLDTVEDGAAAVQAAANGAYDLILMDVHMPVMDGMDATRAIRASAGPAARTPILALTANVQPEQVEACREAGMDGHVGKPIQIGQLIAAMAQAMAQGECDLDVRSERQTINGRG